MSDAIGELKKFEVLGEISFLVRAVNRRDAEKFALLEIEKLNEGNDVYFEVSRIDEIIVD